MSFLKLVKDIQEEEEAVLEYITSPVIYYLDNNIKDIREAYKSSNVKIVNIDLHDMHIILNKFYPEGASLDTLCYTLELFLLHKGYNTKFEIIPYHHESGMMIRVKVSI